MGKKLFMHAYLIFSGKNRWSNLSYNGLVLIAAACSMNQSLRRLFFQVGINP